MIVFSIESTRRQIARIGDARVDLVRMEAKRAKEMGAPAAGGDASSGDMHSHVFYRSCILQIMFDCNQPDMSRLRPRRRTGG